MRRFKTINKIDVYEIDGKETSISRPTCEIKEHPNNADFIRIGVGGKTITVMANDLLKAISNAQNAHQ